MHGLKRFPGTVRSQALLPGKPAGRCSLVLKLLVIERLQGEAVYGFSGFSSRFLRSLRVSGFRFLTVLS